MSMGLGYANWASPLQAVTRAQPGSFYFVVLPDVVLSDGIWCGICQEPGLEVARITFSYPLLPELCHSASL